jgi:glutamate/tyrosine decarboxylase-like PLP-dependent enzyme
MQIPELGKTREEIFEFLKIVKSQDARWEEGRMFAYVYDPGKDVMDIGQQAYLAFMVENALDPTAFPSILKLETDVVRAVIHLLRGDQNVVGNLTTGGTESILLAVKTARDWARAHRPEIREPAMVMCQTAHHAFHKAAHYFGLKVILTPFAPRSFQADVAAMRDSITPDTVLLVGSAPSYSQGVVDPIPEMAALAQERGLLCHVDACVGGLHLAFLRKMGYSAPEYDWSVPGVTSISADLQKFGYCPKPASVVMYRDKALRRFQIFTSTQTTCYSLINPTVLSSKTGGPAAAAWAVLNYLGENGYKRIVTRVQSAADRLMDGVNAIPGLQVMGRPDMCVFAFTSDTVNVFQLSDALSARGWTILPQFGRPGAPANLHLTVHYGTVERVEELLAALRESVEEVRQLPPVDLGAIQKPLSDLIAENPPDLFERAAALAGIRGDSLPDGMAAINTLLAAMPDDVQAAFLTDYFNNLYA